MKRGNPCERIHNRGKRFLMYTTRSLIFMSAIVFPAWRQHTPDLDTIADNPYDRRAQMASGFDALIRDTVLGEPGSSGALEQWLRQHPDAPREQRHVGFDVLCRVYGVRALYEVRVSACSAAESLAINHDDDDDRGIAGALVDVPPIRAVGSARLALHRNGSGSEDIDVSVNGVSVRWVFDTGAEISVVSDTTARQLKLESLPGRFKVGTTTQPVFGQLAVINLAQIGVALVENVPVLILPDEALRVGGGQVISAIMGLPVMNAFRRIAWINRGETLLLGDAAPALEDNSRYRIFWHPEGIGIPIESRNGVLSAHFDTGSNNSFLRNAGVSMLSESELHSKIEKEFHMLGAGGMLVTQAPEFPEIHLLIAGSRIELKKVSLDGREDQIGAARIGVDMVLQCQLVVLDFESMRMKITR
jgi:predicted aspartyl protease